MKQIGAFFFGLVSIFSFEAMVLFGLMHEFTNGIIAASICIISAVVVMILHPAPFKR